ncbi:ferredoxin [candidate division WOR-1 bacterium RIFOXYB2_FULL_42_35]|uniref:Ferredoxin n=1 Tax=candidate division WOR-1 bacterium RIFOXYC2_FULL_41_25 TaxID=1802586 RepID=A0A1F4TRM3_UNCSA|nr:MAG: ferredoxin [candidate division WOR-1 bacterium RIFOXYA2_FULL_41_14]OGC25770.1 MAG: ferredoxin [candidate division WOR-1 bacterium RIFOXYB2_FULL_42_35]OGC35404.1 MAG: ferredoxin [candidate division WOR-1 bacterium RIFOXYC2_FULL_41_25]
MDNNQVYLKNVATLKLDVTKCIGCNRCIEVCPHEVLVMEDKKAKIVTLDACMECGACAKNCPTKAITVKSGVGCAAGIINGILRGTEPTCDCSDPGSCC